MADFKCSSESCLVHIKVMTDIENLKREIADIREALKDKVDCSRLEDLYRQVDDMKNRLDKLTESDIRQSEALAGIHAVLAEFKEIHKSMRDDYGKLVDAQIETSTNIATIKGILQGQSEAKVKVEDDGIKFPWYIKILKLKPAVYFGIAVLVIIACTLIFGWADIIAILKVLVSQPPAP